MSDIDILKQIEKGLDNELVQSDILGLYPCYDLNQYGQVTALGLCECKLINLHGVISTLAALKNLTQLDLSCNELSDITPLAVLSNLTQLDLSYNHLSDISPLAVLSNLMQLDLSNNQLSDISPLAALSNLTKLNLNENQLSDISPLAALMNLMKLNLYHNQLSDISPLKDLRNLKSLLLTYNSIEELPVWITDFDLEIDWTAATHSEDGFITIFSKSLRSPPPDIVMQGKGAIKNYFQQIKEQDEDYLFEAKMLIIGEPGAGKTSLARKIVDMDCDLPKENESTPGIEVKQYYFPVRKEDFKTFKHPNKLENRQFRLNIWDFGGQEIYKATHRFFLSERSLYALVADSRNEDTDFNYWLNIVEMFGGDSPLLIVLNEKLQRKRNLGIEEIKRRFTNISDVLDVDFAETNKCRLIRLENAIRYYASQLRHIGDAVPSKWTVVREALEQDKRNTISLQDYLEICKHNGISRQQDILVLSQYFHDIGVFLHFQKDELLHHIIFLKPNWATHAVYKILDHPLLNQNNGCFNRDDAAKIWCNDEYDPVRHELLRLMQKFYIAYEIDNSGEYIVPERLPAARPDYPWDNKDNLILQYKYEYFMPKGILSQFIVQMHRFIGNHDYVWRRGVVLEREHSRAEIIERYDARTIKIRLAGKNRRDFLTIICDQLDRINSQYEKMKVGKLIPCNCDECKKSEEPFFYEYQDLKRRIERDKWDVECGRTYKKINVLGLIDNITYTERFLKEIYLKKRGDDLRYCMNFEHVDNVVIQHTENGDAIVEQKTDNTQTKKSSWANGSFYLFSFLSIIAILGYFAGGVPAYTLALIIVAGILGVPIIGALQLRQDDRLSEKSFLELVKIVFRQLPLIEKIAGKAKNKDGR